MASADTARRGGLVGWTFVSPGYFEVLHIPIVRGRDFDDHDDAAGEGVVIINQAMAQRFWPSSDPLGDSILAGRGVRPDYEVDPIRRVIGIVGNVRDASLTRNPRPAMYVPVAQVPDGVTALNVRLLPLTWIVRTRGEPYAAQAAIDAELRRVSGGLPVARVRSMDDTLSETTARSRFATWLMTAFGVVAMLLSAIGVYGLLAYSVQQRVPEIGIRLALGADPRRVGGMILLQGMRLAVTGIAVGVLAAWSLAHLLGSFLFGVTPRDPLVFAAVPTLLTTVALVAIAVPMLRAAAIEPSDALRSGQ
jgi:predicted permease